MITPGWAKTLAVLTVAAFVALGSLWIELPGLEYDETLFVLASYPRDDTPIAYTMHIGGRPIALMVIDYLGALKGWLCAPALGALGGSPAVVRGFSLAIGAAGLSFLYLFCRRAFGWTAACIATALAATDPIYLFTTRMDWGPVAIQRLCLLAGCFAVLRWRQKGRWRDLALGFFALGLGVFDKATFLWLLAGLAVATVLLYGRRVRQSLRPRAIAVAVAGLLVGAAPFLYYNWKWPGETFRRQAERDTNYVAKLRGLQYTLEGTILVGWFSRDIEGEPLAPPDALARAVYRIAPRQPMAETLLLPALTAALVLMPALPFTPWGRGMLFALVFSVVSFGQMLPIRNAGAAHHLALIEPFPQIIVAAGLAGAAERLLRWNRWRRAIRVLLAAATLVLVAANLRAVAHHYFRFLGYGGNTGWSEAIYPLHRSLEKSGAEKILLLDWGIGTQLRILSQDRLPLAEAAQPQGAEYDAAYLDAYIRNPRALYVKHAAGEPAAFPQIFEAFERQLARLNYRIEPVETIKDRRGRAIFEILAARPRPAAATPAGPPR